MNTESSHLKRIAWAIKTLKKDESLDKGINDTELSKILGVDKNTLVRYRQCKGSVKSVVVGKLITHYKFNPHWLFLGQGEPFPGARNKYPEACGPSEDDANVTTPESIRQDFISIPYIPDPSINNLTSAENDHYLLLWFRRSWIDKVGGKAGYLTAIKNKSDCMEPTLLPGDLLLINRDPANITLYGGIYVLDNQGTLSVRRVQCEFGNPPQMVKLMCDNKNYETVLADIASVTIYGKVIWYARSLVSY